MPLERLSLPRRNYQATEGDQTPPKCRPELPKDPLPTWVTLPMDAKLPMIPGPKNNVMLYTTNLGEKMHLSSQELDFDLSDPYALTMSNNYKPLHDPHLKPHLDATHMRKRLHRGGFITKDGKVVCTLKEYNEYRQYLRKINLLLDKKRNEAKDKQSPGKRRVSHDGDRRNKDRDKVKSLRERLDKQFQEEKEKHMRQMAETDERRQRLREQQMSRMSERDHQLRLEHARRQARVEHKQEEDRTKKMEMLRTWMREDGERCELADMRKAQRVKEQQSKLAYSWEERKKIQAQRLEQEQRVRREAELVKQRRLKERERVVNRQRRRQQAIYERMTKRQREERERIEAEYARNMAARLDRRKKRSHRRKTRSKKLKITAPRPQWVSHWDATQILLQEYSDSEVEPRKARMAEEETMVERDGRRVVSDMQFLKQMVISSEDEEEEDSFREWTREDMVTPSGFPTAARITLGLSDLIKKENDLEEQPGAQDLASALIFTNNYLASEVVYPAIKRHKKEAGLKQKKSIRFSLAVEEMPFIPYDYESYTGEDDQMGTSDMDDDSSDEGTPLKAVDSLTQVRRLSACDQSPLAGLADILCRILERLEKGELSEEEAAKLSAVARDILLCSLPRQGDGSDTSLTSQSSSTSLVAAELVKTSMDKVQNELLKYNKENTLEDFYEWPPVKNTSSELTGMSKFVAETAIAMAVESLMSCTDDIIERQRTSASDSQLLGRGKAKESGTASDSKLGPTKSESTESVSCSSDFIIRILNKVLEQVRDEKDLYTPGKPVAKKIGPRSNTSLYIMDVLQKVVAEVQAEMAEQTPDMLLNQPKSKTSLFVMDTLERVVKEIERSRSPSATSLYIDSLLCDVGKEVAKEKSNLSWDKSFDLKKNRDKASVTSLFIRNTLSKVLHEIEADFRKEDVVSPSVTSLFADEIVKATLKKCVSAVGQEMLPGPKLTELTAAIISSQQKKEDSSCPNLNSQSQEPSANITAVSQSLTGVFPVQNSASVNLAESLIKMTLEKAKESLSSGSIRAEQVVQVLSRMNASSGSFTAIDVDGKPIPASQCSLQQANEFVQGTIQKTLQEIEQDFSGKAGDLSWSSQGVPRQMKESDIAALVQSILEKAVKELNLGLTDESAIEKMEIDIRQSLEDTSKNLVDGGTNDDTSKTPPDSTQQENNEGEGEEPPQENQDDRQDNPSPGGSNNGGEDEGGDEDEDDNNGDNEPIEDFLTDDEDLDKVVIQPIFHGKKLDIDPKIAGRALMAISVKKLDHMEDLTDPLPRNSFRNLFHPDMCEVKGVDTSSNISVKSDLVRASVGALPSQTRMRIKAASYITQGAKKAGSSSQGKETSPLAKARSFHQVDNAAKKTGSQTSPFSSPTSSPKPSGTKITKASLVGASAPSLRTVTIGRKSSPSKLSSATVKEAPATPVSSRKSLVLKKSSETAAKRSPSASSKKSTDARSPSVASLGKKQTAPKEKSSSTTSAHSRGESKKESLKDALKASSTGQESKVEIKPEMIEAKVGEEPATENANREETEQQASPDVEPLQAEEEPETPPEEIIEVSKRNSRTKKDMPLPRESGPIEMLSSTNPPSVKRSSESNESLKLKKSDIPSPPGTHRSIDLAPRPSSGFKKAGNSYTTLQNGSQESLGTKDQKKHGSTHSLSSMKSVDGATVAQARQVSSDSKIKPDES